MKRKIIRIEEEKCNGCGACAKACHEGAIAMVGGKARLIRDDYCDGLGDCLPACPTGAISFEEREAAPYDEAAVAAKKAAAEAGFSGCPGSKARVLHPGAPRSGGTAAPKMEENAAPGGGSALRQWPVQLQLVPVRAPYFDGADLLVAADCAAYARGDFHSSLMAGRVAVIGCPKLDAADYAEKLTGILTENDVRSVTVVRMEVPCCGGIENAVRTALSRCKKRIPSQVITLSVQGELLD